MEPAWDPSFKPFFRYAFLSFLPPYTNYHKIGYFTTFATFTLLMRTIPLLLTEKGSSTEWFFLFATTLKQILRGIVYLYKRKSFQEFSDEINKFIEDNQFNPINSEEDYFLIKIWKNNFAFQHAKWFFMFIMCLGVFWQNPVLYDMAINLENVTYPYYPLYSPYFDHNSYTKVIYTVTDVLLHWNCMFNVIHNETVFMSLLSFLYCQYLYLKELLDEMCFRNEKDPAKMEWWIRNHCRVIRFTEMIQNFLAPIIAINYICLIVELAACLVILSEAHSVQSLFQKYVIVTFCLIYLFENGCNCCTSEKINKINESMHEHMYPWNIKNKKIEMNMVFRMVDFMSKKPIKLSGLGFYTFNNERFSDLVFRSYSFYSSLVSLKKPK